ncbi:MAG TPA: argininosuccinate lyase [Phycisphaerae bacterium]|nr:argininosuccinate lyase [Phycisphaerae bacterium]
MKTLWKQQGTLHPSFAKINRSLEEDWFLLPFEIRLQLAHAKTLEQAGIFSADECVAVEAALKQLAVDALAEGTLGDPPSDSPAEDIHTWVESELVQRVGDVGKKIHTARSRNDQVATLLVMYAIDAGSKVADAARQLSLQLCDKAMQWAPLVFPLQTHCQFAAPGSVGFWALKYAAAFERSANRLSDSINAWKRACPLGSGAVAGSSIPIDRKTQATLLGFDGPSDNALDSTSTRDACLELLADAAHTALHLQSFATDVIAFAQTSLAWVAYPAAFGTGSSMMPNKTNPDAMELLRGECNAIVAAHNHALLIMRGLPSGYNRDLQCIKPVVQSSAELLTELLEMTTHFTEALAFRPENLKASLQMGHIDATLRMEEKVQDGMAMRDAHHAVAGDLDAAEPGRDIAALAKQYQTIGSASPEETVRIAKAMIQRIQTASENNVPTP